ncbi:four helix bundle protein [Echinicola vietnamensis]|uniref:S23 ribosomal protein n=1 Tax=Echinicola vietnamensis (strain DSM 17526 / LMG 23754 / KMM 6221) TaxID=926556 RepID=L0FWC2_ECHVK|nr:four helix bundle protein [Echinicola vietnamensis]AGA77343.1 S23 ribosomal protein [Echinicola vietnamensis DSM 17526]
MNNYKELKVWKRGIFLAKDIYVLTATFPHDEKYGLVTQMRRSAVSVASNIAEGAGRGSDREFRRFMDIAYGSLCELDTQLCIAKLLDLVNDSVFKSLENEINEMQKMSYSLIKSLK